MAIEIPPLPAEAEEPDNSGGPIGVPDDYMVTHPNRVGMTADALSRTHTSPPRYWSGAEWTTARDMLAEDRAAVQMLMKQLGFIDAKTPLVLGQWDQRSASAFKQVLAWANVNGTDWQTALASMATSMEQFPQDVEARAPLTARVSNPDDLRMALRETFKSRLGQGSAVDEAGIDRMIKAYQQEEIAFQQSAYNAEVSGGTVTEPPSVQAFADMQAKIADPTAYDSRKVVGAADYLARKLRGEV